MSDGSRGKFGRRALSIEAYRVYSKYKAAGIYTERRHQTTMYNYPPGRQMFAFALDSCSAMFPTTHCQIDWSTQTMLC